MCATVVLCDAFAHSITILISLNAFSLCTYIFQGANACECVKWKINSNKTNANTVYRRIFVYFLIFPSVHLLSCLASQWHCLCPVCKWFSTFADIVIFYHIDSIQNLHTINNKTKHKYDRLKVNKTMQNAHLASGQSVLSF